MSSKFWRIVIFRAANRTHTAICELEMFNSSNPTQNLCVGGQATSSGNWDTTWVASKAFDGIKTGNIGWHSPSSPTLPAWLQYEFPEAVEVDSIAITNRGGENSVNTPPTEFVVQYLNDQGIWVDASYHVVTDPWILTNTNENETKTFNFDTEWDGVAVFTSYPIFTRAEPNYKQDTFAHYIFPFSFMDFRGEGTISGQIHENGIPSRGIVTLMHHQTQNIIKRVTTDELGKYEINGLSREYEYDLIAQDISGQWEKQVSSRRTPYYKDPTVDSYNSDGVFVEIEPTWSGEVKDMFWEQTSAILPLSGDEGGTAFFDAKGNTWLRHGAPVTTKSNDLFGEGVALFNGTTDYLRCDAVAEHLAGLDTFTIETWFYSHGDHRENDAYICAVNTSTGGNTFLFGYQNIYVGSTTLFRWDDLVTENHWHHIALVVDQGVWSVYLDGHYVNSSSRNERVNSTDRFSIAQEYDPAGPSNFFSGKMSNFRVTAGAARYTEDFVVPEVPFSTSDPHG